MQINSTTTVYQELEQPLIVRLLDWLAERARAADGQGFVVGHRTIAEALGCSPGALPKLMARLEAARRIVRDRIGKYQAIRVLSTEGVIDHGRDRSQPDGAMQLTLPLGDTDTDEANAGAMLCSPNDRDRSALHVWSHDDSIQEEEAAPHFLKEPTDARYRALLEFGAAESVAQDILNNQTGAWTMADLARDWARALHFPRIADAKAYVLATWRRGRRLTQEVAHVPSSSVPQPERAARTAADRPIAGPDGGGAAKWAHLKRATVTGLHAAREHCPVPALSGAA